MAVRKNLTLYKSLFSDCLFKKNVVQGFVQGCGTLYNYGRLSADSGRSSVQGLRARLSRSSLVALRKRYWSVSFSNCLPLLSRHKVIGCSHLSVRTRFVQGTNKVTRACPPGKGSDGQLRGQMFGARCSRVYKVANKVVVQGGRTRSFSVDLEQGLRIFL